jgi:hypothetical protein
MNLGIVYGDSPTANFVALKVAEANRRLQHSQAIGNESLLTGELGDVWEECREPDWDGYGALPVTQDALRNAYRFLESLPLGFPRPSLGADATGCITVEWYRGPRRQVSVSVDADGILHYAALIGPNRIYGSEVFFSDFPIAIFHLLNRIYS